MAIKITGGKMIRDRIKFHLKGLEEGAKKGLLKAGLFVENASNEIVLHDTGNLLGSSFTNPPQKAQGGWVVTMGYTAEYAAKAHELPLTVKPTTEGTTPQFLAIALHSNSKEIFNLVNQYSKTGLKG